LRHVAAQAVQFNVGLHLPAACFDALDTIFDVVNESGQYLQTTPGAWDAPAGLPLAALATLQSALQPFCLDAACQEEKDALLILRQG
jgi:hypothetical protein